MKDYIETRVKDVADYIINTGETIREVSKVFGVSKSTIHKDANERLIKVIPHLYNNVGLVLQANKAIRHIHGGESTKNRYRLMRGI